MRKMIIKKVLGIELKKTTIMNPEEILPEDFQSKKTILDVHCNDEKGRIYDFEMQVGNYSEELGSRFQFYNSRLLSLQIKKGEDYKMLNYVYNIIFLDDKSPKNKLIIDYTYRDKDGDDLSVNKSRVIIVFLKTMKDVLKETKIKSLDEFETLCYILAFNPDDDILSVKNRSVEIMMSKYEEMLESKELFTWAEKAQMVEYEQKQEMKRIKETGLQEGLKKGIKQGRQEGRLEIVQSLLLAKYGIIDEEWINGLNENQIDTVIKACLTTNTLDELKQNVDNN